MRKRYKKFGKRVKRTVDNKMRWQGDYDTDNGAIRVNKVKSKKKSSIIDTITHEEMHRQHPNMWEKTIDKKVPKKLKKMSKKQKQQMYNLFLKRR